MDKSAQVQSAQFSEISLMLRTDSRSWQQAERQWKCCTTDPTFDMEFVTGCKDKDFDTVDFDIYEGS